MRPDKNITICPTKPSFYTSHSCFQTILLFRNHVLNLYFHLTEKDLVIKESRLLQSNKDGDNKDIPVKVLKKFCCCCFLFT